MTYLRSHILISSFVFTISFQPFGADSQSTSEASDSPSARETHFLDAPVRALPSRAASPPIPLPNHCNGEVCSGFHPASEVVPILPLRQG